VGQTDRRRSQGYGGQVPNTWSGGHTNTDVAHRVSACCLHRYAYYNCICLFIRVRQCR